MNIENKQTAAARGMDRLGYRLRYYWRKAVNFAGLCYRCGSTVNYTRKGKAICPRCGK
jgi:rRNA maturation endonuclease Nob1